MNFSLAGMRGRRQGVNNNNNNNANDGGNRRGGGMFGESEEMAELRTKRRDLERGAEEKIKALLNEEQVGKLPTRGDNDQERGRGRDNANEDQPRRRGADNADRPQRRPGRDE